MIGELRVRDLGVIEDVDLVLGGGLTVITGETGTGKTLVVEALQLLLGGRADSAVVRSGATECRVEGRFELGDEEIVLARIVPSAGRSRAYIDDRMTPVQALEEQGRDLVDLHGQHDHQSLLRPGMQRVALDRFAGVDLGEVEELRREIRSVDERIDALGGDDQTRERRLDLLRFERDEIAAARIVDPGELSLLEQEQERLASAVELRAAASAAHELLVGDGQARDSLGLTLEALGRFEILASYAARVRSVLAEVDDLAPELRDEAERSEEDPERLAEVQARRALLQRLARKHGGSLDDVLRAASEIEAETQMLDDADATRRILDEERQALRRRLGAAEGVVGDLRRGAAGPLSVAVAGHFADLALPHGEFSVEVGPEGFGNDVEFVFRANPGEAALPLARVASGGELARVMLALGLVLSAGPPTFVFDEVDAGIGGEVGLAVGRALAKLGEARQVLVVSHLAQVAAFADHHVVVEKATAGGRTRSSVRHVEGTARVVELSRMLSGQPDSPTAREHASELLALAGSSSGRGSIRT